MKATLIAKIISYSTENGMATLALQSTIASKVDTAPQNAKDCSLNGILKLKMLVAEQMKIGSTITITISDEEKDERSF